MSVEATPTSSHPGSHPRLSVVRPPHPALTDQQAFVARANRVLRRAGACGDRLTTALYLILSEHAAVPAAGGPEGVYLRCSRCWAEDLEPALQYPCPTALEAVRALDAVLV